MSDQPSLFLSSQEAGPHFRWGKTATTVTVLLSALSLLSLFAPDVASVIISIGLQLVGGISLIVYIVLNVSYLRLNLLKLLLRYRNWANHPRSGFTRMYLGIVGMLGGEKPKLWRLQPTLPPLPVPPLKQTMKSYLDSVRPLVSDEAFEKTKKAVIDFQNGLGPKLQELLVKRAKTEPTSWLLEWWEGLVYLKSRYPLTIYSNWYGLDRIDPILRSQVARAANLVNGLISFKRMVDTQTLEPNRIQGTVPLCMWQYSRIFGSVRVPGEEIDSLQTYSKSKHIVVIHRDKYFKVDIYDGSEALSPADLQIQFTRILEQSEDAQEEVAVAALTSQDRTSWAKHRQELIAMDEVNKATLEAIETALFVLVFEEDSPATVEDLAQVGLHRNGKSLWYDKNFNLVVTKNGRMVANVDHTWSDASVMVHVFDFVFSVESSVDHWVNQIPPESHLPQPQALEWKFTEEFKDKIRGAQQQLDQLTQSVSMHVLKFQAFGKGLVKKFSMSPDAFCQMAIQLAYYKLHGGLALTYESAGTVRFRYGRTETVRSATSKALHFVQQMESPDVSDADRLKALQAAVKEHVKLMRVATNGDGIDRHMLGLRVLASGSGAPMPEIFTDASYELKFKLSTSQTPATGMLGGGFAPLAEDGYAASYVVAEDRLWFHISTYAACPTTSPTKLAEALKQSLAAMRDVCFADPKIASKLSKRLFRIQRVE